MEPNGCLLACVVGGSQQLEANMGSILLANSEPASCIYNIKYTRRAVAFGVCDPETEGWLIISASGQAAEVLCAGVRWVLCVQISNYCVDRCEVSPILRSH